MQLLLYLKQLALFPLEFSSAYLQNVMLSLTHKNILKKGADLEDRWWDTDDTGVRVRYRIPVYARIL